MTRRISYYTLREAADLLYLSYDSIRAKVYRGTFPALRCNGRVYGIPKVGFWEACAQMEADGQIRAQSMPQNYRTERLLFLGKVNYDSNVLYGKKGVRT